VFVHTRAHAHAHAHMHARNLVRPPSMASSCNHRKASLHTNTHTRARAHTHTITHTRAHNNTRVRACMHAHVRAYKRFMQLFAAVGKLAALKVFHEQKKCFLQKREQLRLEGIKDQKTIHSEHNRRVEMEHVSTTDA